MPQRARLKVYGQGGVEVERIAAFLVDLRQAYNSILVFDATLNGLYRASREFEPYRYPFGFWVGPLFAPRRGRQDFYSWPPTPAQIESYIPASEELILASVRLESPGVWEFLGQLLPFEVIRKWLNDRHERRKDKEYRETAEQRRLVLENLLLENQVLAERVRLAKDLGATDRDLAPLRNELIGRPLTALGRHQDSHVIEHAEVSQPVDS